MRVVHALRLSSQIFDILFFISASLVKYFTLMFATLQNVKNLLIKVKATWESVYYFLQLFYKFKEYFSKLNVSKYCTVLNYIKKNVIDEIG